MGAWARIADLESLPDGRGIRVEVAGRRIAVFRLGDEALAVGDRCSHAEASLAEGEVVDREVECPRHGAVFDLETGLPQALPATKPVPVYPTRIDGGTLYLSVDHEEGP